MRMFSTALLCATIALSSAGCAERDPFAPTAAPETTFEVTPAVAATTGATVVVALGVMAIVACGIACAN